MRIHKTGREIKSVEDWFAYAPPKKGAVQWKDTRSAKELARCWLRAGTPKAPDQLVALLKGTFGASVTLDEARPECIIELDDFSGEHRNCDLVVLGTAGAKRMVINIEAKADEPFGELVGEYFDRMDGSASNVPSRVRHLSLALFGREPDHRIRSLRYQLLHAAAATLIEAQTHGADFALFLIHEFRSASLSKRRLAQNQADWQNFVNSFAELHTAAYTNDQLLGPVAIPGGGRVPHGLPLYMGKFVTELG